MSDFVFVVKCVERRRWMDKEAVHRRSNGSDHHTRNYISFSTITVPEIKRLKGLHSR